MPLIRQGTNLSVTVQGNATEKAAAEVRYERIPFQSDQLQIYHPYREGMAGGRSYFKIRIQKDM